MTAQVVESDTGLRVHLRFHAAQKKEAVSLPFPEEETMLPVSG